MNNHPAVSIVVPTYNREKLLPISVESVLRQTFADWELLIIDDRSTDGTRAVVEDYARRDPRIKYHLNRRTKGPSGARNQGIDLAAGDFVAFLDSDDAWEPHHLQDTVYYLRKYSDQIDLISANAIRKVRSTGEVYDSGEPDFSGSDYRRLESAYVFNPATLFDEVLRRPFITTQAMVMHRALLDRVRFDEEIPPGPEDRAFHLELAYHQAKVAHLQSHHVTYWAHGENLSISGGLQDPSTKLPLFLAFEVATLRLNDRLRLNLTPEQRKHGRDWLVHLYFWCIGYNGYLRKGEFRSARRYFLKAIRLRPFAPSLWKTYFVSFLKQLAYRGVPARE